MAAASSSALQTDAYPVYVPSTLSVGSPETAAAIKTTWTILQLVSGTFVLPALVVTFLVSKRAKRHPTLVNLVLTWVISALSSLMLFYAGQDRGPEPNKTLCQIQAGFMQGLTPMWSVGVLMLMLYMRSRYSPESKLANITRKKLVLVR